MKIHYSKKKGEKVDFESKIFLDGKNQVADILSSFSPREKNQILSHIKKHQPQLAEELFEQSLSLDILGQLHSLALKKVTSSLSPGIFGLALKAQPLGEQKKILSRLERSYAEKAFEVMQSSLKKEESHIKKACQRVKKAINHLLKNKTITFDKNNG